ncbi:type I-E CRISPR-associated endoribonuclease Cas2e [Rhodocaloribacter litoris]|uniref:type I-E CRISPR-associated endoribonuclease Cas2e n=1 Tax=Rhodocaloribacter litoris TaxID=2558931 RepID=UPI00141EC22C|nr:type I-E CRISPR-associated endoribonuclease Cas2e [Rhodocaloribacter litoris]QXD16418.1 type I-E CRISPR-associated endoribonuclease Cas2e [Rhodocaloribacter litoris]
MTVMILERVTPSTRGDLSRWMIEVKTGVFVGRLSALVRDNLWKRCLKLTENDDATLMQIWSTNNEQGFDLRVHNPKGRFPYQNEGIWLVMVADPDPRREP